MSYPTTYTKCALPAGAGRSVIQCPVTITPDSSTNYADGDSVGGLLTFTGALPTGSSRLVQLTLTEKAATGNALKYAMDLVLLTSSSYSIADNAAFVAATADLITTNYHQATVPMVTGDYYVVGSASTHATVLKTEADLGGNGIRIVQPGMVDVAQSAQQNVYGYLIWKGGANKYASSGARLLLRLTFEID